MRIRKIKEKESTERRTKLLKRKVIVVPPLRLKFGEEGKESPKENQEGWERKWGRKGEVKF